MRIVALVSAALAVALPSFALSASQRTPVATGLVNADMPPERFRGGSVSVVVFTDREGIEEMCGKPEKGNVIIACHRKTKDGVSIIAMPNPCILGDTEFYAKIACHENGHANGWGREHEV